MKIKTILKRERQTKAIEKLWKNNTLFFLNELVDYWKQRELLSIDETYFEEKAKKLTGRK